LNLEKRKQAIAIKSGNLNKHTPPPTVRIEKLVPGGNGLGYLDKGVVFVPLAAPGDLLSLREVRRRRGVHFAETGEVIESSSLRRVPPCPWFGRCGGCQWMHMDYDSQIRWKEDIFRQALRGIAKFRELPPILVHKAPDEFQYRFRARLQIKESAVGFYRRGSNKIVPWERCLLLPDALNLVVENLRVLLKDKGFSGMIRSCEVALSPVDQSVTLNWIFDKFRGNSSAARMVVEGMEEIASRGEINLVGQTACDYRGAVVVAHGGSLPLEVDKIRLWASPGTFFQVNPEVNEVLVKRVLSHLRSTGSGSLLDLYCGNGNFSLPAAASGLKTVGVESSPGAVLDALSASASDNRFIEMDTVRFLEMDHEESDAVIVDPPRTGLPRDAAGLLGAKRFSCLIYVSCEPSTLARDLARLTESGYEVSDVELFDMFPQTSHSEALVVMKG
jgi:23S rRNA (uracil1939-C5)-methyltransferase